MAMAPAAPSVPDSALADLVLPRLTSAYGGAADPVRAASASAYMRDAFPFLGIATPARRTLSRAVLAGTPRPDETDCAAVALRCWTLAEREYRYFAVDYLRRHVGRCSSGFLGTARHLITADPWWDTVDLLAAHVVGRLVAADPALVDVMDEWVDGEDLWLARTALLHQLTYKTDTDAGRLFRHCLRQAGHRDFFIRKAIGWALREYARTDPDAVRTFLAQAGERLSPLSVREAGKHL
jgi:3-methyladenine DNA glycosylase AlkD